MFTIFATCAVQGSVIGPTTALPGGESSPSLCTNGIVIRWTTAASRARIHLHLCAAVEILNARVPANQQMAGHQTDATVDSAAAAVAAGVRVARRLRLAHQLHAFAAAFAVARAGKKAIVARHYVHHLRIAVRGALRASVATARMESGALIGGPCKNVTHGW